MNNEQLVRNENTAGDLGTNRTCDKNEINYLCAAELVNYAGLHTHIHTHIHVYTHMPERWAPWSMQQISAVGNFKDLTQISESSTEV